MELPCKTATARGMAALPFAVLLLTSVFLPLAMLTGDAGEAFAKKKAKRGSLTIKVGGVAPGTGVQIGVTGPKQKGAKAFRASLTSAKKTILRGLKLGRYTIKAKEVEVSGVTASPDKPVQVILLTKKRPEASIQVSFRLPSTSPTPPSASAPVQTPAPAQPSPGATPQPLRFNIAGAVGLATTENVIQSSRSRRGAREIVSASNLQAVFPSGEVRNAITSGRGRVLDVVTGPDGKVYLTFNPPVNLNDASLDPDDYAFGSEAGGCVFVVIVPGSEIPSCLDPEVAYYRQPGDPRLDEEFTEPPLQFDGLGNIYYLGVSSNEESYNFFTVLRKKASNGSVTDLINPNIDLQSFFVLEDDSVLINGYSRTGGGYGYSPWLRRITSGNTLQTLLSYYSSFIYRFSDGNIYIGSPPSGGSRPYGAVRRFNIADATLVSQPWIGDSSTSPTFSANPLCVGNLLPRFCGTSFGSSAREHLQTRDGQDFIIAGPRWVPEEQRDSYPGQLVRMFPTLVGPLSQVSQIRAAAVYGDRLLLAGRNEAGQELLTSLRVPNPLDPNVRTEVQIIEPGDGLKILDLEVVASEGIGVFRAETSSGDRVIGEIDLATDSVQVLREVDQDWTDFKAIR